MRVVRKKGGEVFTTRVVPTVVGSVPGPRLGGRSRGVHLLGGSQWCEILLPSALTEEVKEGIRETGRWSSPDSGPRTREGGDVHERWSGSEVPMAVCLLWVKLER